MPKLKQIFLNSINEADEIESKEFDGAEDEAALQSRLTKAEADPNALDIEPGPQNTGYRAEVAAAEGWIQKIEDFVVYLNDTQEGSINNQINVLDRDNSVFKGIASRVSDKLARVSSDLAELREIIAGFIISSDRKAKTIRMQDSLDVSDLPISEQVIEKLSRYGFDLLRFNEGTKTYMMSLKSEEGEMFAQIDEDGLVNGENVDSLLERANIELVFEDCVSEDVVMDEHILKQIKDIDEKLTHGWDQDLYSKRRELLDKMQKTYIDVSTSLIKDKS